MRDVGACVLCIAAALVLHSPAAAQEFDITGQVRPRSEYRDTLPGLDDAFTSMRVRIGVAADLDPNVGAFIQLQDVRIWGEEQGTLQDFDADHLDLHQGYLEVRRTGATTLSARVGRQELSFGGERLIGTVNWAQQGRSFDALRLAADGPAVRLDAFAAQIADATAATRARDEYFLGAYGRLRRAGPGALDLYVLFNHADADGAGATGDTDQATIGGRWAGDHGRWRYRGEASLQLGERGGSDVTAFLLGARAGVVLFDGTGELTLWYDYLSGDDDPSAGRLRVFDTLFATNHPLYGFADHFTDIPRDTGGRGLQDVALKIVYRPAPDLRLALDLHAFRMAAPGDLATARLGEEIDLTAGYRVSEHLQAVAGASYLAVGRGMREIGRTLDDAGWAYLMLDAAF